MLQSIWDLVPLDQSFLRDFELRKYFKRWKASRTASLTTQDLDGLQGPHQELPLTCQTPSVTVCFDLRPPLSKPKHVDFCTWTPTSKITGQRKWDHFIPIQPQTSPDGGPIKDVQWPTCRFYQQPLKRNKPLKHFRSLRGFFISDLCWSTNKIAGRGEAAEICVSVPYLTFTSKEESGAPTATAHRCCNRMNIAWKGVTPPSLWFISRDKLEMLLLDPAWINILYIHLQKRKKSLKPPWVHLL